MFERLRETFANFISAVTEKELTEKELERTLKVFRLQLISNDVAAPVAKEIAERIKRKLIGKRIKRFAKTKEIVKKVLAMEIEKILSPSEQKDLLQEVKKRREENISKYNEAGEWKPYVILFLGPNGSGKTVTIAKIAWLMKKENLSPVLAASDTFRAGSIEQLEKHAKAIGVTIIKRSYKSDPASVAYDAISHAVAKRKDAVLIDTAGRLGTNINLMEEMRKIARVANPDMKILVVDALAGNDLVIQAEQFTKHVGVDGNILTKVDADVKGGAALTLTYITRAPIIYVGIGQKYYDLAPFNPKWFVKNILGENKW